MSGGYRSVFTAFLIVLIISGCDGKRDPQQSERNFRNGVTKYQILNYKFDVPLKYYYAIYEKYRSWPTPKKERIKVQTFEVDALLPDMRPYSDTDRSLFEERGFGDKVYIHIRENNRYPLSEFFSVLGDRLVKGLPLKEAPSLIHLINVRGGDKNSSSSLDLLYASLSDDEPLFEISCHRPQVGKKNSYCDLDMEWKPGLLVSITFSRKHLSEWRLIKTNVSVLLSSFEIRPQQ